MSEIHIHKGFPNAALSASDNPLDLNQLLIHSHVSTYIFRVETDAWENIGIFKGDIAIIDKAIKPKPNALIAVASDTHLNLEYFKDQPEIWGVITSVIHIYK